MRKKDLSWMVMTGILTAAIGGVAQAEMFELDPIVVTATRTPVELSKAPANVSVISGEQLENRNYGALDKALETLPGVAVNNYSAAGYSESNYFYINGSKDVVLMVDGVRMNSAGIFPPLSLLRNMDNIERVEVLKGAGGALYGASAKGGVINIITKKSLEDGIHGGIEVGFGNFGTQKYRLHAQAHQDQWNIGLSYLKNQAGDFKDGHGEVVPTDLDADEYNVNVGYDLNKNNKLRFRYMKREADEMYSNWIGWGVPVWGQQRNKIDWDNAVLTYEWQNDDVDMANVLNLSYNHYHSQNNLNASGVPGWENDVETRAIQDQFTWQANDAHTVVAGYEYRAEEPKGKTDKTMVTNAFYLQDEWAFAPQWKFITGARYETTNFAGSETSPHATLQYELSEDTNVYVGYNQFFVAPTPFQLYDSVNGNPDLKPEKGYQWEVGVNHRLSKDSIISIDGFIRKTDDAIAWVMTDPSTWAGEYQNVSGTEDVKGVQVQYNKHLNNGLGFRVGYTYTDLNYDVHYVPKHLINLGVDYQQENWNAYLDLITKAKVGWKANPLPDDTYTMVNVGGEYRIADNIRIHANINNLLDKYYAEVSNVQYGAPGQYWAAPGRSYYFGVNIEF